MFTPEIGKVLTGKRKIKSVAANAGMRTSRKKIDAGKTRKLRIIRRSPLEISRLRQLRNNICV